MDFFEVVHTQRSIRRFKPDPVPPEAIRKMIDAAIRAPSGSNTQPWIWLVVQDQAKREAIARAVRQYFEEAGSLENMRRDAEQLEDPIRRRMMVGAADFFENVAAAPVLIIPCLVGITSPVTDGMSLLAGSSIYGAVQNLMLAARAQGLGTVLTTFNSFMEETLRSEFHLPQEAVPACIIPVGYPDGQRFGPTSRKPVETVTYWDDWGVTS
jgi:F420 biosynthesis protein FbiB-like protein